MKIGDVVMLKSGGPRMTVVDLGATGLCHCSWFEAVNVMHTTFPEAALDLADGYVWIGGKKLTLEEGQALAEKAGLPPGSDEITLGEHTATADPRLEAAFDTRAAEPVPEESRGGREGARCGLTHDGHDLGGYRRP